jgi:hypothetical protein
MASSLLEQTREAHEAVERLERLVVTHFPEYTVGIT